jgi:hypothetical protein
MVKVDPTPNRYISSKIIEDEKRLHKTYYKNDFLI